MYCLPWSCPCCSSSCCLGWSCPLDPSCPPGPPCPPPPPPWPHCPASPPRFGAPHPGSGTRSSGSARWHALFALFLKKIIIITWLNQNSMTCTNRSKAEVQNNVIRLYNSLYRPFFYKTKTENKRNFLVGSSVVDPDPYWIRIQDPHMYVNIGQNRGKRCK